jgi:hypothetical protein
MTDDDDRDRKRLDLIAQKQSVTGRISETTRFVGFGLLAVYFAIRTADSGFAAGLNAKHPRLLLLMGICGLTAILLDYLQYWFGSWAVAEAMRRESLDYDPESLWYKARGATFVLKQAAAIAGALFLIIIFASE